MCASYLAAVSAKGVIQLFNLLLQVQVQCDQRRHQLAGDEMSCLREKLQQQLQEEKRVHSEIESYLKKHIEVSRLTRWACSNGMSLVKGVSFTKEICGLEI